MRAFFLSYPNGQVHRNCPDCAIPMRSYQCENVIIERCLECQGIWFDHREIAQFRKGLEAQDLEELRRIGKGTLQTIDANAGANFDISGCPICNEALDEGIYAGEARVRVRRCARCQGIWLPGRQVLNFVDFIRVSQLIADDVRAVAIERLKSQERISDLKDIADVLNRRVNVGRAWMSGVGRGGVGVPIPLYDGRAQERFPWAVALVVAGNVVIYLVMKWTGPEAYSDWTRSLGLIPSELGLWKNGYRIGSHLFTHAGLWHLVSNLYFLIIFGRSVEDRLGAGRFLFIYFAAGISGSLIYASLSSDPSIPLIGASGAISGILGAYLALFPRGVIHTFFYDRIYRVHIFIYVGFWLLLNIGQAMAMHSLPASTGGVAWDAHVAGFFAGLIFVHLFRIRASAA